MFVEQDDGGGPEIALLALAAFELDFAEVWRPSVASAATAGAGDSGLGAGERRPASRSGMRFRRHPVSASSWNSWVSVGVSGRYSSRN